MKSLRVLASSRCLARGISFAGALTAAITLCSCGSKETPKDAEANAVPAEARPGSVRPEIARLAGKWERADGDYTLQIKSASAEGKLDASYFNPGPINVSRAVAVSEEGKVKVFVELQDVNYPGCTYTLAYDPAVDQLFGTYYQAAMQQTFDVTFARKKDQAPSP